MNDSQEANEETLNISPYNHLISLQDRIASLENQVHQIEFDLPQNVSKSILYLKKEIQTLFEKSNSQSDSEVPYVYSEVLEKIGDFQRKIEWKLNDTVRNRFYDISIQFEENNKTQRDDENENNEAINLQKKVSESLANLKSNVIKSYEEDRKTLNDLEDQITKIKFQSKTVLNSPTTLISHIASEIESQQKQINELEKTLNRIPNLINNSRRLAERFSGFTHVKESDQSIKNQKSYENYENRDFQINNIPDLSIPFSTLEGEVQATITTLQLDLENILKRIDDIDQKTDENEKQVMQIADAQGKAAELLSDVEDKALSMLDKADDFSSKLSVNSDSAPLEEMEKETRIQLRDFKREIAAFKSAISKREAQIAQNVQSTT